MNEDDIVSIGLLRRPRLPSAAISYDPTYGIRVDGEAVPPDPAAAGAWCRRAGGWLRLRPGAVQKAVAVKIFLKSWRTTP